MSTPLERLQLAWQVIAAASDPVLVKIWRKRGYIVYPKKGTMLLHLGLHKCPHCDKRKDWVIEGGKLMYRCQAPVIEGVNPQSVTRS